MTDATLEPIDVAIVGGGVVGLAAACAVAARGHATCVIERLPRPGLEASTHNSGVVHAGIYYPRDSLKAALCVEGRERLYAFCDEHGVPCVRCGKLIVAVRPDEIGALEALARRGHANGASARSSTAWRTTSRTWPAGSRPCTPPVTPVPARKPLNLRPLAWRKARRSPFRS